MEFLGRESMGIGTMFICITKKRISIIYDKTSLKADREVVGRGKDLAPVDLAPKNSLELIRTH